MDINVSRLAVGVIFFPVGTLHQPVERAVDTQQSLQREVAVLVLFLLQVDGNHHVGTHRLHHIHGQVVEQSAVHQHPSVLNDGLENTGN